MRHAQNIIELNLLAQGKKKILDLSYKVPTSLISRHWASLTRSRRRKAFQSLLDAFFEWGTLDKNRFLCC